MTEMGIPKNVIIFGAAMSCMEKCSRADIAFQLMKRMKEEGIAPNVHIYNSAISACARCNLWEKGYELYEEMDREGVKRDVVTFNAGACPRILSIFIIIENSLIFFLVLDAVCSQIQLGRKLFKVGVERGFYAKVSRLGEQWFELDLHFLSLGGGEIALGWWFEECLVPYLTDTDKLATVKSISIVTGYGKTRTRGRRHGDDGMRKRCRAMLRFMGITESDQPNLGRIHIHKENLIEAVNKNGGKIIFDLDGYLNWKEAETTSSIVPDTVQKIRARFKPTVPGSGRPPFTRVESEFTSDECRFQNQQARLARLREQDVVREDEYQANIDYAARDGINFDQGMEERNSRFNQNVDYVARGGPRNFHERDMNRGDSSRYMGDGPRGHDVRMGQRDSRGWTDGESSMYEDGYPHSRFGQSRDFHLVADPSIISNNGRLSNGPPSIQVSQRDFYREGPSTNRFDEPFPHREGPNSQRFEERFSTDVPFRHGDRNHRSDQWSDNGKGRLDDRILEGVSSRSFRSNDRDIGSDQSHYPVSQSQSRRFGDDNVERSGPFDDLRAGERGYGYQQGNHFDDTHSTGIGRSERDMMPHEHRFRRDGRNGSIEGRRNINNGDFARFGSDDLHDSFTDGRGFSQQGQLNRTGYRDGIPMLSENHVHHNFIAVDLRTNDRTSDRREHDSRAFQQSVDHKRHHEVLSQQSRDINLNHGLASNSRGYALEPQSQRRRLS